ncbi:DUF4231 domain-containing protein [Streptomyces sp. NPDC052676]|uniref:DUF4231 domain-containing protein n=1 Tax=Streptomyces sp. NPDC052676 TaxID=3154953 RepID=UPI00342E1C29
MDIRLNDSHLPELFARADALSLSGQWAYLRGTRLRLTLAVCSAILAVSTFNVGAVDIASFAVAVAFLVTLLIELWLLASKPERNWYDGRALAESIKTLTWKYAVGAQPYTLSRTPEEGELRFIRDMESLIREMPSDSIVLTSPVRIPERIQEVRDSPLHARRSVYLRDRIENQIAWYSGKARTHVRSASRWRITLVIVEGLGIVAALLKASGIISVDLPGILAAVLGAGSAWLAARQHESLGRAYTFAANDLSIVHARLRSAENETAWAQEVADAEEAISREHTMWRASRGSMY